MKLYIAEKPSLGRAIAAVLPKPHKNHKTHIECANGDVVTWCVGHILEMSEPEDYEERFKRWNLEHLPIHPKDWQLKPKYKTRGQLTAIRKLCIDASVIVHAGDPDREGQLLVDEVLNYIKLPKSKLDGCRRVLISDLTTNGVKLALNKETSNSEFKALSISALARSRADWLFGLNLTRGCTIKGKSSGYNGVLSIGRVQTPVLSLIVERDQQINNFVPHDFYQVVAHIQGTSEQAVKIEALWQPSKACEPYMDDEGRVILKGLAQNVCSRISNQPANLIELSSKPKRTLPPLPFSLSSLQIEAAKAFKLSAQQVLSVCQSLYEKHKLITYPRSDCRYLPKEQLKLAPKIMGNLAKANLPFSSKLARADISVKSRAFDDKKVGAHHGITPTEKAANLTSLTKDETLIYQLISRNFAAQFYTATQSQQQEVLFEIAGGQFLAKGEVVENLGWQELLDKPISKDKPLPKLNKTESYHCTEGELLTKQTSPPSPFNDATLLAAMTGIARFVQDPKIKATLKETDGLGTEATRAGIIETLFKRGYIERRGKSINATKVGKALISTIPEQTYSIERTASWEQALELIAQNQSSYFDFIGSLDNSLTQLIEEVKNLSFQNLSGLNSDSFTNKKGGRRYNNKTKSKRRYKTKSGV